MTRIITEILPSSTPPMPFSIDIAPTKNHSITLKLESSKRKWIPREENLPINKDLRLDSDRFPVALGSFLIPSDKLSIWQQLK